MKPLLAADFGSLAQYACRGNRDIGTEAVQSSMLGRRAPLDQEISCHWHCTLLLPFRALYLALSFLAFLTTLLPHLSL